MRNFYCWAAGRHEWLYNRHAFPNWRICKVCRRLEWCADSSNPTENWVDTKSFTDEIFAKLFGEDRKEADITQIYDYLKEHNTELHNMILNIGKKCQQTKADTSKWNKPETTYKELEEMGACKEMLIWIEERLKNLCQPIWLVEFELERLYRDINREHPEWGKWLLEKFGKKEV